MNWRAGQEEHGKEQLTRLLAGNATAKPSTINDS